MFFFFFFFFSVKLRNTGKPITFVFEGANMSFGMEIQAGGQLAFSKSQQ